MNVYICSAARTAIGTYGGTLRDVHSSELGTAAAKAAIERAGVDKEAIDEVLFGQVLQGGVGQNVARQVCLKSDHHPGYDPEQGLRFLHACHLPRHPDHPFRREQDDAGRRLRVYVWCSVHLPRYPLGCSHGRQEAGRYDGIRRRI